MPSSRKSIDVSHLAEICLDLQKQDPLKFNGEHVLTEAATGPFAATACLAALAGADVYAVAKKTAHGSREEAFRETRALAKELGVSDQIQYLDSSSAAPLKEITLLTNSGRLRPIRASFLRRLNRNMVVSLMVEPWEIREKDIAMSTLKRLRIPTAGPNESHPELGVFHFLGPLLEKALSDQGIEASKKVFYLHCEERFEKAISAYFRKKGFSRTKDKSKAEVVVLGSCLNEVLGKKFFAPFEKDTLMLQLWAEVPRRHLYRKFVWLPPKAPPPQHMGFLLSELGPEPAIRLSFLGLKVGELLLNAKRRDLSFEDTMARVEKSKIALPPLGW